MIKPDKLERKMSKRIINELLLFLGIGVGLLTGEFGLRIYEKHSSFAIGISQTEMLFESGRRWWGMASLEKGFAKEAPHYIISRNPKLFYEPNTWFYGFKSTLQDNPNAYRIFVLGDSTTRLKPGVELDTDYYPSKLELLLNQDAGKKYQVVNCGIPGYATEQEVEFLATKLLIFKPAVVVVGYCLNDRDIKHRIIEKQGYYQCTDLIRRVPFCSQLLFSKKLYINSELYKLFNYSVVRICKTFNWPISYVDLGSDATIKSLQRLKQLAKTYNFKIVFVIFPAFENYEGRQEEQAWIRLTLENLEIDFVDMEKEFDKNGMGGLKLAKGDRYHFNSTGHVLVAEELYNYLQGKL